MTFLSVYLLQFFLFSFVLFDLSILCFHVLLLTVFSPLLFHIPFFFLFSHHLIA